MNDNDIITASDLNNIAADLGKTTFANYNDTQTYNIDSLNDITAAIVSKGILSRFDKCACSLIGTALTIKTGIIVFESGAKIRITSNKIINIPDSTNKYYVYAHRDATTGTATIQVQTALPESGDIVELCEIDGGILTDKRTFATSKVAIPATETWNRTQTYSLSDFSVSIPWNTTVRGTIEIDVQGDDFGYLIVQNTNYFGMYDIKAKTYRCTAKTDKELWLSNSAVYYINTYSTQRFLRFNALTGGKLKLDYEVQNWRSGGGANNTEAKFNYGGDVYITLT